MAKATITTARGIRLSAETYSRNDPHDRALLFQEGAWVGDVPCGEAYALERGPELGAPDGSESDAAYEALETALFDAARARHLTPG